MAQPQSERPLGSKGETIDEMDSYDKTFDEKDLDKRAEYAQAVTVKFYNLITDFYEYGWGQSFHFATRYQGEAFHASIARHEHFLSQRMGIEPGEKVLDVGCGVMGPAREIARFSGAHITGLNLNEYQIGRCKILNEKTTIPHLLDVEKGDFMHMPFPNDSFDRIYAIEALCHAPDRVAIYKEVFSKVKPGGIVGLYEWAMTDKYDPKNEHHKKVKHMIEYGNSICELGLTTGIVGDLEEVGFVVKEGTDLARDALKNGSDIPWYATLEGGFSLSNIKHSKVGRMFTQTMTNVLEYVKLAPTGTGRAHTILTTAAEGLVMGGQLDIFTPMYLVIAQKPLRPMERS